jgi:hypothetical protein
MIVRSEDTAMANSPDTPDEPKPRVNKEYEDPHYHDEDEVAPVDDSEPRTHRSGAAKKKPQRRPPPPRRFYDD